MLSNIYDLVKWLEISRENERCLLVGNDILKSENAKLRELIQKVWKWERNGCYECPLEKDCKVLCVYDGDCGMAVKIEKELQELGIEESDD